MVVLNRETERKLIMKNEVSSYLIFKAFRDCNNMPMSVRQIAEVAYIDSTSENLREIRTECFDFIEIAMMKETLRITENEVISFFSMV